MDKTRDTALSSTPPSDGRDDSQPESVSYTPIGIIRSEHRDANRTPIQPLYAQGCRGAAILRPEFAEGLADIEGFSHLFLLYHFHQAGGARLAVKPFTEEATRGLFATRHPQRPNPIGLSLVRLEAVEGRTLRLLDVDVLDGTPLLDIKPYVPRFDRIEGASGGWTGGISDEEASRRGHREYRGLVAEHLLLLARQGSRANAAVAAVLEGMPKAERLAQRGSFAGSLQGLLDHIAEGALYFQRELRRSYPSAASLAHPFLDRRTVYRELNFPSFAELAAVIAATDRAFVDFASEVTEGDLARVIPVESLQGTEERTTLLLLLQALNHATHHRGQISQLLDEMGIANDYSGIEGP